MITKTLLHKHANIQISISIFIIQPLSAIIFGLQIVPPVKFLHTVIFILRLELQTHPPSLVVDSGSQN